MKVQPVPSVVLRNVTIQLQPFVDETLTTDKLIAALRAYEAGAEPDENLITIQHAAKLLGCSRRTVYRLLDRGKLNRYRSGMRGIRVNHTEVMGFRNPVNLQSA